MGLLSAVATHEHNKRVLARETRKTYSQRKMFKLGNVGQEFECNGNVYVKVSTRTARMLSNKRAFYFKQVKNVNFKPSGTN